MASIIDHKDTCEIEKLKKCYKVLLEFISEAVECPLHHVAADRNLFNQLVAITEVN